MESRMDILPFGWCIQGILSSVLFFLFQRLLKFLLFSFHIPGREFPRVMRSAETPQEWVMSRADLSYYTRSESWKECQVGRLTCLAKQ